jgi:hypothetical protein
MDFVTRAIDKLAHKLDPIFETHTVDPTKRFGNRGRRQMTFGQLKNFLEKIQRIESSSEDSAKRSRTLRKRQNIGIETQLSEPEVRLGIKIAEVNSFTLRVTTVFFNCLIVCFQFVCCLWNDKVSQFNPEDTVSSSNPLPQNHEHSSVLYSSTHISGRNVPEMVGDQSIHLDADTSGLLTWMNYTAFNHDTAQENKSYLGVYLYSAGCISAIRKLAEKYYDSFVKKFQEHLVDGKRLCECMKGPSQAEKLSIAWSVFVNQELVKQKKSDHWKRVYVEVDEFEAIIASLSTVHFGARFPLKFGEQAKETLRTLSHVRMHSYLGRRVLTSSERVQETTIDLRSHKIYQAALQFIPKISYRACYISTESSAS